MDDGSIDNWSSHLPVLVEAVVHTTGPVLELGSGHYSTRVLHALSGAYPGRRFVTCDCQGSWLAKFADLASANHELTCAPTAQEYVDEAVRLSSPWEVVFVDEAPAQHRVPEIVRLRPVTRLFIVNNTEPDPRSPAPFRPVYRGYAEVLPTFKYVWTYKRYPVWTSVMSDFPLPEWVGRTL